MSQMATAMPQSLAQIYVHLVFSTKNRQPLLADRALRERMHAYLAGTAEGLGSPALIVGGVEDHVHILCNLSRTRTIADTVKELKREPSIWIKNESLSARDFDWQDGYGAFSISPSHVDDLKGYILDQEQHHRRETFQDELRRILKKYGINYDERYLWD